jgi:hypothetical protein
VRSALITNTSSRPAAEALRVVPGPSNICQ